MQLDLFEDNRPGILLNLADEYIRSKDLDQAVSVYEQLLADYPDDKHGLAQLRIVSEWRDLLSVINKNFELPAHLRTLWLRIDSLAHPALRSIVLGTLIDTLRDLPDSERIYHPPRFHLGQLLLAAGRHAEAAGVFHAALSNIGIERGRFLAWRGDALTLADMDGAALKCYLAAFLEDPFSVDMHSIKNRKITHLHSALHFEATGEIEEDQEPAWLPVWGWLNRVFPLPLQPVPVKTAEFEERLTKENHFVPRIWFDMLTHAERLRVARSDNRELGAVRRLMKKTNGFMFDYYLEKTGGNSPTFR